MFNFIKKIRKYYVEEPESPVELEKQKKNIHESLKESVDFLKKEFNMSADLVVRKIRILGYDSAIISMDGLIDKNAFSLNVSKIIMDKKLENYPDLNRRNPDEIYEIIRDELIAFPDQLEVTTYEDAINLVTAGFCLVLLDRCNKILAIGVQGFFLRGISEPTSERSQRGMREGFIECMRINVTLIRRRIRSSQLKFENIIMGTTSKTYVSICYLADRTDEKIVSEVKKRLKNANIKTVTTAGCIAPFLEEENDLSLFSSVGISERPDTICGKISEGRIAILIDGTPAVLFVPCLFVENFHNIDDYALRPYFASFNRILKFLAFFISTMLPGLYVALGTFNPELFPGEILNKVALATSTTPFSLMFETILIHFMYEIMREAGLRLPQSLSHAMGVVGGLVIGDAAINAGLIGAPTLMIVALTAMCSYVTPNLYEPIAFLKLVYIIFGGLLGIWGVMMLFSAIIINICSKDNFGVPFSAPISPFSLFGMRDVFFRFSWKILSSKRDNIQQMPGSKV